MAQKILNVRVRPPKIKVLINKDADISDLLRVFQFYSRVWGGRYFQILCVDPQQTDPLTDFRLDSSRPEFVFGVGIDDEYWKHAVHQACQPRAYSALKYEEHQDIHASIGDHFISVESALISLYEEKLQPTQIKRLQLVEHKGNSKWTSFCAAAFGIHIPNLIAKYYGELIPFSESNTIAFIELHSRFVKEWKLPWVDLAGYELRKPFLTSGPLPPTVVLVRHPVCDLSYYWNLKTASNAVVPAWIIPIAIEDAFVIDVHRKLREWLLAFSIYGSVPNYCNFTSQTVDAEECQRFARMFRDTLEGTTYDHVDCIVPGNRLPNVTPFEYETTWTVNLKGSTLAFQPPKPLAIKNIDSRCIWLVDFLRDVGTGRAVNEVHLPSSPVATELLNGPTPPSYESGLLPRCGDGTDSINVLCSNRKEIIDIFLPTDKELIEEILRANGVEPEHDEKRSCYLPVIKRFGGLGKAAASFSGDMGRIIQAVGSKTWKVAQFKSKCGIGGKPIQGDNYLERIEVIFSHSTERMKRVGLKRFAEYAKNQAPQDMRLESVLEYWANRSILRRRWTVGVCPECHAKVIQSYLNIRRRVVCSACGNQITLPERVSLSYAVDKSVRKAIKQGIIPVVLAGRFLKRMSRLGFLWLPGMKYQAGDCNGDIDLVACCDGLLVFCECKTKARGGAEEAWDKVIEQFLELGRTAEKCKANLLVLASLAPYYPEDVVAKISTELTGKIPFLLLNKNDLETGSRLIDDTDHKRSLALHDLIPKQFPESKRPSDGKPREIKMGYGIFTSG
ncbi:MAG: hypothetical protein QM703_09205 [Gemmatales bacterium]